MIEDEYSYPPTEPGARRPVDLAAHGVQTLPPSKRTVPTRRVYATPLDDQTITRIRAQHERRSR